MKFEYGGHEGIEPHLRLNSAYRGDILKNYGHPYAGAIGDAFVLQDDIARQNRAHIVDAYLEQETIQHMQWPA
ncbi:hypothetical protein TNCV_2433961 [Trichonephila clavipes]|nr:hypothetical protein TNCV_2433961 [Trichonephila clavipes]